MFTFQSMSTDVAVIALGGGEEAVAKAVAETFWKAELRFSRFRADSELSWLNRSRGRVTVSGEMFDALTRARAYTEMTSGMFDPAVGGALRALGYDRSFAPGALDREQPGPVPRAGSFLEVVLDPTTREVERPEHLQIDLGGMVKGRTVDAAGVLLPATGAVDAGGDAVLRGRGPSGEGWLVDVEDPVDPAKTAATLVVSDGAVATSAANRRTWRVAGGTVHHLIDPRARTSASTDLTQATVIAPRAELADVLAKTAFLLGSREARRFLENLPGIGAVLLQKRGVPLFVGGVQVLEVNHG